VYRASVVLYLYSPCGPYGLYRVSVELYLYSPYGPYGLYRASVELYLYSPYGPYGTYRSLVPAQVFIIPLPYLMIDFADCWIKYHIFSVLHNMDNIKIVSIAGAISALRISPIPFKD
jgi:rRNA maturation protein Nop10